MPAEAGDPVLSTRDAAATIGVVRATRTRRGGLVCARGAVGHAEACRRGR
jgi:hypothetical protein